jgi:uncharacterized membrane protein YedE/YeeE
MTEFTPVLSLIGGAIIGLATVALMAFHGRIAGINGIAAGLLARPGTGDWAWRAAFIAGMIASPLAILFATGQMPEITVPVEPIFLVIGGFLVGIGASLGSGCTSGHGVCGMSRLSVRSIVATLTFMTTGLITVYVMRHVIGG